MAKKEDKEKQTLPVSFEEGLSRLEEVLGELEQPAVALDASLGLFGEGIALVRYCQGQLAQAEEKLNVLLQDSEGALVLREAEFSADDTE